MYIYVLNALSTEMYICVKKLALVTIDVFFFTMNGLYCGYKCGV